MGLLACLLWSLSSANSSETGLCKGGHIVLTGGKERDTERDRDTGGDQLTFFF